MQSCVILIDPYFNNSGGNKVFIIILALAAMLGGGTVSLLCGKKSKAAMLTGSISLAVSSAVLFTAVILQALLTQQTNVALIFQIPIAVLGFASALFSPGYLAGHGEERSNLYYFFLNFTIFSMFCVTLLRNDFLFLLAWELMGLASAALVMFDFHSEKARKAAFLYFVACHLGAAFLIVYFLFPFYGYIFPLLALIGFGLKIGLPLLHVWLPEAHPAAPAPVSAIMSGAMIELGFLGLIVFGKGSLPAYFGYVVFFAGIIGALWGIISALPQKNLKRLLAYSSMENMGICSIAFGYALLADHHGFQEIKTIALCGMFLHIINHAFLKGGLFLGAGAIQKSCGTLEMDKMGGLLKRAPHTGSLFILNAAGISGLPPFNGFISEFVIYYAAFQGLLLTNGSFELISLLAIVVLALTGGFAAAAMTKAAGIFTGEPRTKEAAEAKEVTKMMRVSMYLLFTFSLLMVIVPPVVILNLGISTLNPLAGLTFILALISIFSTLLIFLILFLRRLFCRGGKRISPTWDCGYAKPDARMEYTATAFTQPLADYFEGILKPEKKMEKVSGIFPVKGKLETTPRDLGMEYFWKKITGWGIFLSEKVRVLQSGNLHAYIFMILLVLAGMLIYAMLDK